MPSPKKTYLLYHKGVRVCNITIGKYGFALGSFKFDLYPSPGYNIRTFGINYNKVYKFVRNNTKYTTVRI